MAKRYGPETTVTDWSKRLDCSASGSHDMVMTGTERPKSIDMVVTSPPYFGVADYIKSQRLSFEWFGYEIESRRIREIGARSKRHRQTAVFDYNDEIRCVVEGVRTVLKPGGVAIIVMGESKARQSVVDEFRNTAELSGLTLDQELRRSISFRRRQHPSISEECILVFTRR
jgi:DNA modification methylase